MLKSTIALCSVAVILLAVWVASLTRENRWLREVAAGQTAGLSAPSPARFESTGPPPTSVPSSPGSYDRKKTVEPPSSESPPRFVVKAAGTLGVKSLPDGTLAITAGDGTVLSGLTTEAARGLAQSIQAALLDATATQASGPSWSPGKVAGAPDTEGHGDFSTAWASQDADAGSEWLQVEFERAVEVREIVIHETFNPGALAKVSALLPDGSFKTLWEGTTPAEGESVERALPVPPGITSNHLRIELDTHRVPGWNEIDAVQLVGTDGSRQWASQATASSYYGQNKVGGALPSREFQGVLQGLRQRD